MLVVGTAVTGFIILIAIFAPWVAPYGFAQYKDDDGNRFEKLAPPSSEHWFGTTDLSTDVLSRVIWGAVTALEVVTLVGPVLGDHRVVPRRDLRLLRRCAGSLAGADHGRAVRVPVVPAGRRVRVLVHRHHRRGHLVHQGWRRRGGAVADLYLHPAVLPRRPQHDRQCQAGHLHRGGARARGEQWLDHAQVPVRQRRSRACRSSRP